MKKLMATIFLCTAGLTIGLADDPLFHHTDSLALRDEYGPLHQSPVLYPTDWEHHYHWRPLYYLRSGCELSQQPAYVGALQANLRRLGYYCGPIDGFFSPEVSDAIARYQKNSSMTVTGTITNSVRRGLYLP